MPHMCQTGELLSDALYIYIYLHIAKCCKICITTEEIYSYVINLKTDKVNSSTSALYLKSFR